MGIRIKKNKNINEKSDKTNEQMFDSSHLEQKKIVSYIIFIIYNQFDIPRSLISFSNSGLNS